MQQGAVELRGKKINQPNRRYSKTRPVDGIAGGAGLRGCDAALPTGRGGGRVLDPGPSPVASWGKHPDSLLGGPIWRRLCLGGGM